jgi:hypothetical protein
MCFLGVWVTKKGYRCYNPTLGKVFVTMDVTFLEEEGFYQKPKHHFQEENCEENGFINPFCINVGLVDEFVNPETSVDFVQPPEPYAGPEPYADPAEQPAEQTHKQPAGP